MRASALCAAAAFCCLMSTGCATFVTGAGPDQKIRIVSEPRGAHVYVDDDYKGLTPVSVTLTRADHHRVRVEREGYQPFEKMVKSNVNPWILGNIILGGLIGLGIDVLDGSVLWVGGDVHAKMVRAPGGPGPDGPAPAALASSRVGGSPAPPPTQPLAAKPAKPVVASSAVAPSPARSPAPAPARASKPAPPPAARATPAAAAPTPGPYDFDPNYTPSRLPPRRQPAAQ